MFKRKKKESEFDLTLPIESLTRSFGSGIHKIQKHYLSIDGIIRFLQMAQEDETSADAKASFEDLKGAFIRFKDKLGN